MNNDDMIYLIVAIAVAITSATIMRVKLDNQRFDFLDASFAMFLGAAWPLTIVISVVYLISGFLYMVSGFLYSKFFKAKKEN